MTTQQESRQAAEDSEIAGLKAIQTRVKSRQFMQAANRLPTLFDLEDAAMRLLGMLDYESDLEPEDIERARAELVLIDQMMVEKTESYVSVIRSLEAMAEARKVEADRLRDRAKAAERHADWLRNRLLVHMQTTGRDRVETSRFTLSIRKNPQAVTVLDAAAVPHEFERTKITVDVDKRAILEHFRTTGEIVDGVSIDHSERLVVA